MKQFVISHLNISDSPIINALLIFILYVLLAKIADIFTDKNENPLRTPEPRVRFREFGESSLNFELLCWAKEPASLSHRVYLREEKDWKR